MRLPQVFLRGVDKYYEQIKIDGVYEYKLYLSPLLISSATLFSYAQHVACSLFLNYTLFCVNIQSKELQR